MATVVPSDQSNIFLGKKKKNKFLSYLSYAMFLTHGLFFSQLSSVLYVIFEIQYPEADLFFQLRPYQCEAGQSLLGHICLYITQKDTSLSSNNMTTLTQTTLIMPYHNLQVFQEPSSYTLLPIPY